MYLNLLALKSSSLFVNLLYIFLLSSESTFLSASFPLCSMYIFLKFSRKADVVCVTDVFHAEKNWIASQHHRLLPRKVVFVVVFFKELYSFTVVFVGLVCPSVKRSLSDTVSRTSMNPNKCLCCFVYGGNDK